MKKISRILEVLTKEGLLTLIYFVKANLQTPKSEEKKYKRWRKLHEKTIGKPFKEDGEHIPVFSIVILENGKGHLSKDALESIRYPDWEILELGKESILAECIARAKGEYIGFVNGKDHLAACALQRVGEEITSRGNQSLLLYSDEDMVSGDMVRKTPFFKPDYSPDTLRSFFYMGGFLVFRKDLLEKLDYCSKIPVKYGGYLLALEASFHLKNYQVSHMKEVLYHRREDFKKPDIEQVAEDKRQLFRHYQIDIITEEVTDCEEVRIIYPVKDKCKISIIIPSKDNPGMLEVCLNSIFKYTRYPNYDIIVVDNGSEERLRRQYEQLLGRQKMSCTYHYEPMEFNFSKMCNIGANKATGDYYLFLNDDIEVSADKGEGPDWLERLLGQAMQPHTGAVGAKLLYPGTNKIQHIGVVNYESGAAHLLSKAEDDKSLLFGRNRLDYNYSIVTGACMMLDRDKFRQAQGFEESLAVTFNDVELCFKLLEAGYYNVVRNDAVLYHHESITRGEDSLDEKRFHRHLKEREKLFAMHPAMVKHDAFYSSHLTQKELNGEVNIEVRRQNFKTIHKTGQFKGQEQCPFVVCRIEFAEFGQQICIRGFAYVDSWRYNNLNRIHVVLKGKEETIYASTQKIYNPTIAPQMESQKNLNFVEFYTCFPGERLKEEVYQIGVHIRPFARRKEYRYMTETYLKK